MGFINPEKTLELATKVKVLTVETEHEVDATALEEVQKYNDGKDYPSPCTIKKISR